MENTVKKGLSGTALKWIALVLMTLDHIHYIFGFTGVVPDVFSMAGRLAAPLFLFCLIEGFSHTHDRKAYFLKIYLTSAGMTLMMFLLAGFARRSDGFFPLNGMMTTFALLLIIWQGMDDLKARHYGKGVLECLLPLIWPIFAMKLEQHLPDPGIWLMYSLVPTWGISPDAMLPFILTGMVMYALRNKRGWKVTAFVVMTFLYDFVYMGSMLARMMPDFAPVQMLTMYYEWFGIFSAPLMLCYNGQRGRGMKKLFYVYYPAHIYIFYVISCLMLA